MNDFSIREYRTEDIPAIKALWIKTFQDPEELVDAYFALLPDMGAELIAERDGKIVGIAGLIVGMELIGDGKERHCGYIYAVAVEEDYRSLGIGAELCRRAEQLAYDREAELVCTLPADEGLYAWYKMVLDFDCALRREKHSVEAKPIELCAELSSTEYMLWRENMLRDKLHLHLSTPTLEFLRCFCKALGGGLYACGSGICAAYLENSVAVIKELISMDSTACDEIAASVAAALGTDSAEYYLPSVRGDSYIAAKKGSIAENCVWNISFD